MIEAGATRLGTSAGVKIVRDRQAPRTIDLFFRRLRSKLFKLLSSRD